LKYQIDGLLKKNWFGFTIFSHQIDEKHFDLVWFNQIGSFKI